MRDEITKEIDKEIIRAKADSDFLHRKLTAKEKRSIFSEQISRNCKIGTTHSIQNGKNK